MREKRWVVKILVIVGLLFFLGGVLSVDGA